MFRGRHYATNKPLSRNAMMKLLSRSGTSAQLSPWLARLHVLWTPAATRMNRRATPSRQWLVPEKEG
jgi:hypothetical protein